MSTQQRKDDHIRICNTQNVDQQQKFFDQYSFEHCALPELNFEEIDTKTTFLDKQIALPLLISSMTGGSKNGETINKNLALAAQKANIPLGVGSQRAMLEHPESAHTFEIRKYAPTIPLLANIGAVQLNYGLTVDNCIEICESIQADALILHINPLQEVIQHEGDTNFSNLLSLIEKVVKAVNIPVIAKEVGMGISFQIASQLKNIGVTIIDVAGKGGTSWSYIEGIRSATNTGEIFANWGIPTPQAIFNCSKVPGIHIIGSGGIRNGLDIAKALALGAHMTGIALPFLHAAQKSSEDVYNLIMEYKKQLQIAMFCTGSKNVEELKKKILHYER